MPTTTTPTRPVRPWFLGLAGGVFISNTLGAVPYWLWFVAMEIVIVSIAIDLTDRFFNRKVDR